MTRTTRRRPAALMLAAVLLPAAAPAQLNDADSLYGIHWYSDSDPNATQYAGTTDAENMAPGEEMWVLEITHLDTVSPAGQADLWVQPSWYTGFGGGGHASRVTGNNKGHSLIFRIQPNWGRNVPYFEAPGSPNNDPFTLADYANAAAGAAGTLANYCRIWQVGNEVNLDSVENVRWNPGANAYNIVWQPTPEQYAETYLAVRDALHTVTPNFTTAEQIALMQPVSPGNAGNPPLRFLDGNEYLWRQIEAVPVADRGKIDGFALHGYAEPGGPNDGVEGFFDSIREQIMIIDQLGLHDRPIFITEFNKHMPNAFNAGIGARFVQKAFETMHNWNTGVGDAWPGVANHDIVAACWFVFYDGGGWTDYSLQEQKTLIASTDPNTNPWYGFQEVATNDYPAGSLSGGGAVPMDESWWADDFDTLDTAPPLPDWKVQNNFTGSVAATGNGAVRFTGNGTSSSATIFSSGYVYGDFRLDTEFEITDSRRPSGSTNTAESNFEIRIREGSRGYSLTFFTDDSDATRRNRVILRRTNAWTQIGSFNEEIGITSGDRFRVSVVALPDELQYTISKNNNPAPVVSWTVPDNEQRVGWVRLGTFNLREAEVDRIELGGPQWAGPGAVVNGWMMY